MVDSKLCQLEQMKEQQMQREMDRDYDEAWNEVRCRGNFQRNERENFISKCRVQEGRAIQDFQKIQMADKIERSLKIYEEINEERKNFAKMSQEDDEQKQELIRASLKNRKIIGEDIKVLKLR